MGYIMSRYDDVRLDGAPFSIEKRRESFYLRCQQLGAMVEIPYDAMDAIRAAFDIVDDSRLGHGREPSAEQQAAWEQDDRDVEVLERVEHLSDEVLERALELRRRQKDPVEEEEADE